MGNKSITELTELILKQGDMITRKNEFLRHASEEFRNVGKLATMCNGMKFTTAESASEFMGVLANTLKKLSYERFDLLEESNIALPEAVEANERTIDELDDLEEDLPFVTPSEEVEA
jgi:hypothetical protein